MSTTRSIKLCFTVLLATGAVAGPSAAWAQNARHNVVLSVPDGLRGAIVDAQTAPEMERLQQGQGMHGTFSAADIGNFTAAYGPDFKRGFVDDAPVSNADVGMTIARILGLRLPAKGTLIGRPFTEAMRNGTIPRVVRGMQRSQPAANGLATVLRYETAGGVRYVDVAGFPGRTVGLDR